MSQCNIAVLGAGAVGIYFSGRLWQNKVDVTVIARGDYEIASRNGYQVTSVAGDFHYQPQVLKSPDDYQGVADYVIVASKVLPGADQIPALKKLVTPGHTAIVLIQNGVGIEDAVAAAFPGNEVISAIAYIGASRPAPGQMLHVGNGFLTIGNFKQAATPKCRAFASLYENTPVRCDVTDDIERMRWFKLLWNLAYNPTSVLAGCVTTDIITNTPELSDLVVALMKEVVAIANARHINLTWQDAEANLANTKKFPPFQTSMLQDYLAKRPLEVEAILGNPLRMARECNVAVPHLETMYALLKSINTERQKR